MANKSYKNGNYTVTIDTETGTKERYTDDNIFIAEFPESIDCTITYKCNGGCKFCYAGCSEEGKHADLDSEYINKVFLPSLHPYTELALNGNDLSHPQLVSFLKRLRERHVIANLTVNQKHFMGNIELLHNLTDEGLISGLGISLVDSNEEFITKVKEFPNAIIHVIAGLLTVKQLEAMQNKGLKLLILGYKKKGRGDNYYLENSEEIDKRIKILRAMLPYITGSFEVISFDNLAIDQLDLKSMMSEEDWEEFYMGDDGHFTFFVDLVNRYYASDSLTTTHYTIYEGTGTVPSMFKNIVSRKRIGVL